MIFNYFPCGLKSRAGPERGSVAGVPVLHWLSEGGRRGEESLWGLHGAVSKCPSLRDGRIELIIMKI